MNSGGRVLVTGGAGYIGARLVPALLDSGRSVTVLDRMIFGEAPLAGVRGRDDLAVVSGDLRDDAAMARLLGEGKFDTLIQLAAISNDPCSDLDPDITRAINGEATFALMRRARDAGVKRFLYASSASVYGIKDTEDVTEDLSLEPITLYAELKARGEQVLNELVGDDFVGVSVRSATVCGISPRLRLDLTINLLTDHALRRGAIRVFGGSQMRPNVHITDLVRFYLHLLEVDAAAVNGQAFNVTRENATVMALAELIRTRIDPQLSIDVVPTEDQRSYHLSGARALRELDFSAQVPLQAAIDELERCYRQGKLSVPPEHDIYRNVKQMQAHPESWSW